MSTRSTSKSFAPDQPSPLDIGWKGGLDDYSRLLGQYATLDKKLTETQSDLAEADELIMKLKEDLARIGMLAHVAEPNQESLKNIEEACEEALDNPSLTKSSGEKP